VDLEHPLEVGPDRLQLHAKPPVTGNREAVPAHHGHQCAPVVFEDLKGGATRPNIADQKGHGLREVSGEEEEEIGRWGTRPRRHSPTWLAATMSSVTAAEAAVSTVGLLRREERIRKSMEWAGYEAVYAKIP
jgi:hypothetical protein